MARVIPITASVCGLWRCAVKAAAFSTIAVTARETRWTWIDGWFGPSGTASIKAPSTIHESAVLSWKPGPMSMVVSGMAAFSWSAPLANAIALTAMVKAARAAGTPSAPA